MLDPSELQRRWLDHELGLFCHFGINTFYDKEWSDGTLNPAGFSPTDFDARQWAEVARAGGFRYLILTAKHHDGFCLWPTDTTDYSVRSSPFRNGAGDVVAEVAEACRAAGIAFGLYLSPWDRHEPCYRDAKAYDDFYIRQLTELCTRYGDLFELWFDGAGSEGRTYDWDRIMDVVDRHQPNAMIFNMGRPTIRWVGNEDGLADDPNFVATATTNVSAFTDAQARVAAERSVCIPAECDVAIRLNWFWHADDLHTLKTREHMLAIYYRSVGLGSNLLLNMGPDTRGRISDEDRDRWMSVADEIARRFERPIPATLRVADDGQRVRVQFASPVRFDHLVLREDLTVGGQADGFRIVRIDDGTVLATGRTIGHKRILPFPAVTTDAVDVLFDAPGARLRDVTAYLTGHESLPEVGPKVDYEQWAAKADARDGGH